MIKILTKKSLNGISSLPVVAELGAPAAAVEVKVVEVVVVVAVV